MQALDNADRLDPNDPVVAIARTAIALDQYQADEAILRRPRNRAPVPPARRRFAGLAVNRQGGLLSGAGLSLPQSQRMGALLRRPGLRSLHRIELFRPSGGAAPEPLTGRPDDRHMWSGDGADLTSFNLTIQGLFFDPLAVSGRIGRIDLMRRPFLDAEIGGIARSSDNGRAGWGADATVQGFSNEPLPTSFTLTASRIRANGRDLSTTRTPITPPSSSASSPTACRPLPRLRRRRATRSRGWRAINTAARTSRGAQNFTAMHGGAGWSHSFSDRNVLTGAVFGRAASTGATQCGESRICPLRRSAGQPGSRTRDGRRVRRHQPHASASAT